MKEHSQGPERVPNWFRIAIWVGVAIAAFLLAWLAETGGEVLFKGPAT